MSHDASEAPAPIVIGEPHGPTISVVIQDARLARAVASAVEAAVDTARAGLAEALAGEVPVVHLRTRKRLEALGASAVAGVVVVVRVTDRNAHRLPDLVESARAGDPLGVQLVWDGERPERTRVERYVFAVLERARATPGGPPVVLARTAEPVEALRMLIANRQRRKDESRS